MVYPLGGVALLLWILLVVLYDLLDLLKVGPIFGLGRGLSIR